MTYLSKLLIKIVLKISPIAVTKNLLGSNFRVRAPDFLQRRVFRLRLPLPDDVSRAVCQRLTAINSDVVVLPEPSTRALDLYPGLNQFIELDWLICLEKGFEECTQSYRK